MLVKYVVKNIKLWLFENNTIVKHTHLKTNN